MQERTAALHRHVEDLEAQSHNLNSFLDTLAHDLRAPLTNIRMSSQLLEMTLGNATSQEKATRYLGIIESECEREIKFVDNLLDLHRMDVAQSRASQRKTEVIHLQQWLPGILEPFQDRANMRRQALVINVDPGLHTITADSKALKRVLSELLHNAVKYTPSCGAIALRAACSDKGVSFTVANTGSTLPITELPKIFNRFYRCEQTDVWCEGGSGLGLALVQKVIEGMNGSVWVESRNEELRFVIELCQTRSMIQRTAALSAT